MSDAASKSLGGTCSALPKGQPTAPESSAASVAALFVAKDGAYFGLPGVEPWDEERDARLYNGPWPVVAHPPCARWSRLAGFTEHRFGLKQGDDGGCFEAALHAVRKWGGVLEHPAFSKAWDRYGLAEPTWRGGWTYGLDGGASCYVEQGRYGLPVKKATWLYAYGVEPAELRWGFTPDSAGEPGYRERSKHRPDAWRERFRPTERDRRSGEQAWRSSGHRGPHKGLTSMTPPEFRDALLSIARSARMEVAA